LSRIPTWALWIIVITNALLLAGEAIGASMADRPIKFGDAALSAFGVVLFAPVLWRRMRQTK
jgi:hypothetical protein